MSLTIVAHGCDVGPKKGGVIFDGREWKHYSVNQLGSYVDGDDRERLLAWDAPLTGPYSEGESILMDGELTQRPIEKFFNHGNFKVPPGISVRPYCGCPHWTITRRFLGLPRLGRFCFPINRLPFHPLFEESDRHILGTARGPFVVEVHPAVAIWLWCKAAHVENIWQYKKPKDRSRIETFWRVIGKKAPFVESLRTPVNDDELDAFVAWLLADCWIKNDGVSLLGNSRLGSFLVPETPDLFRSFDEYTQRFEPTFAQDK